MSLLESVAENRASARHAQRDPVKALLCGRPSPCSCCCVLAEARRVRSSAGRRQSESCCSSAELSCLTQWRRGGTFSRQQPQRGADLRGNSHVVVVSEINSRQDRPHQCARPRRYLKQEQCSFTSSSFNCKKPYFQPKHN